MSNASATGRGSCRPARLVAWVGAAVATSCGGGATLVDDAATEAEWLALATARPAPLPGAPRLTFAGIELLGDPPWSLGAAMPLPLGLSELVVAGLLRRRDVHFVERRRFDAAVAAERAGQRSPGAPAAGVSAGAELIAFATWIPIAPAQATLEIRLGRAETGATVAARRASVPFDADPVGLARAVVATLLDLLSELDRRPAWTDPLPPAAPSAYVSAGIPDAAVDAFMEGLRAEEAWSWERARRAYQAAAARVGFFEAAVALARTARLRVGGTLGES